MAGQNHRQHQAGQLDPGEWPDFNIPEDAPRSREDAGPIWLGDPGWLWDHAFYGYWGPHPNDLDKVVPLTSVPISYCGEVRLVSRRPAPGQSRTGKKCPECLEQTGHARRVTNTLLRNITQGR